MDDADRRNKVRKEMYEDIDRIRELEGNWNDYLANYLDANISEILDCYEEAIFEDVEED
jgi:hypothetical protein